MLLTQLFDAVREMYLLHLWLKYDLGQKYHAPQVRPDRGSNSRPPGHDSTFHVTETPSMQYNGVISFKERSWYKFCITALDCTSLRATNLQGTFPIHHT